MFVYFKRFSLTVSSTWFYVLIYYLKKLVNSENGILYNIIHYLINNPYRCLILSLGTIIMFLAPFIIFHMDATETFGKAKLIELKDNSFIPSYLGYFFISINAGNYKTMLAYYLVILIFMYFAGVEYFNPIFLLFNYHIYKVESDNGVQCILIINCKDKNIIRESSSLYKLKLYRINNLTYIGKKEN